MKKNTYLFLDDEETNEIRGFIKFILSVLLLLTVISLLFLVVYKVLFENRVTEDLSASFPPVETLIVVDKI